MKWKCINDWFGYCSEEPDGADKARMEERSTKVNGVDTIVKINLGMGATCSLNPKTCGKRQSFEVVCPPSLSEWVEPEVIAKTVMVEQVAPSKHTGNKSKKEQAHLLTILEMQKEFHDKYFTGMFEKGDQEQLTLQFIVAIIAELGEVLEGINWKHWKKTKVAIDHNYIKLELIDIQHFLNNLYLIWGMDDNEVNTIYYLKNLENRRRQQTGY